jgi:hypothetical protein
MRKWKLPEYRYNKHKIKMPENKCVGRQKELKQWQLMNVYQFKHNFDVSKIVRFSLKLEIFVKFNRTLMKLMNMKLRKIHE